LLPLSALMALGSSPHTDWGTLTVVWQDNKRGLQTHCDACNVWLDVNTSSSLLPNGVRGVVTV
jgi:isopenicillin N synthase-like dioxygenase